MLLNNVKTLSGDTAARAASGLRRRCLVVWICFKATRLRVEESAHPLICIDFPRTSTHNSSFVLRSERGGRGSSLLHLRVGTQSGTRCLKGIPSPSPGNSPEQELQRLQTNASALPKDSRLSRAHGGQRRRKLCHLVTSWQDLEKASRRGANVCHGERCLRSHRVVVMSLNFSRIPITMRTRGGYKVCEGDSLPSEPSGGR